MTRLAALLVLGALATSGSPAAVDQRRFSSRVSVYDNVDYNGKFTFSRIRYGGGLRSFRNNGAWAHDYPQADHHLPTIMQSLTSVAPNLGGSNVFDLEDDEIFRHPILYVSEPGFWAISAEGALNLREHLLKGGFIIFDDFEAGQWHQFEASFLAALPEAQFIEIDETHPIFHSFFDIDNIDVPHPLVRVTPIYYGVFENNDPAGRMMALVNYNNDLAEYWEWSAEGLFPVDTTNEAYKLGINYLIYGMMR